jgi:hypothetical protein
VSRPVDEDLVARLGLLPQFGKRLLDGLARRLLVDQHRAPVQAAVVLHDLLHHLGVQVADAQVADPRMVLVLADPDEQPDPLVLGRLDVTLAPWPPF